MRTATRRGRANPHKSFMLSAAPMTRLCTIRASSFSAPRCLRRMSRRADEASGADSGSTPPTLPRATLRTGPPPLIAPLVLAASLALPLPLMPKRAYSDANAPSRTKVMTASVTCSVTCSVMAAV